MRPTAKDLAIAAGVSLATVDRVLNGRPGVKAKTVAKVNEAIAEIGFVRNLAAVNLARRRNYRFTFVLPRSEELFLKEILVRVQEAGVGFASEAVQLDVVRVDDHDAHGLAARLAGFTADILDGVALMAPETPQIRDAIGRLEERGIHTIPFISDQTNSEGRAFVGIDNRAAGATAGRLMGRFLGGRRGDILIIGDSMQARNSLERRLGFDRVVMEDFRGLRVLPSLESYGDDARTGAIVRQTLRDFPNVVGAYIMSSEARMPLQAIRAAGGDADMVIVAHERTEVTEAALLDGTLDAVITQDPGHLVRSAIRILKAQCDKRELVASQEKIRIEILLKDNL
ncbi:LacI family DNA-binding transcriptional regulator [Algicella marina]|uniref:Substrate-binding domain-containing protein n=1 Tax=Algicella marina TaxID=2683284 RepID=A0A6P1T0H1_9RHOB|nr:LacI family DNA-binding transcriptional regulator [Algicella marina]QHQ36228.1 substrate-binding domain-containing protein [Algicella marina]